MSLFSRFDDTPELPPAQQWVLDALLAPGPEAADAFARWARLVDFDALDYSSLRLVPALFERYRDDPACEPYRARMKGIYRYFLFRTNLVAADARKVMAALAAEGVDAMPFKGIALALRHHGNLALRPMADADVLVHKRDLARAQAILQALGWQYRYAPERMAHDVHSHDYVNAAKSGFDLHWYALHESPVPDIDEGLWQRAGRGVWQGLPVRWMGREDLVLAALVNGMREREAMRFEWVVDVARVVGDGAPFDWALVWDEAARRGLRRRVFEAMLMFNRFSPRLLPITHLHTLAARDEALSRGILQRLIAENRTDGVNRGASFRLGRVLVPREPGMAPWTLWRRRRMEYERLSNSPAAPKHIRCFLDAHGGLTALYLHRQSLKVIEQLFDCANAALLDQAILAYGSAQPEGLLQLPPGLLAIPSSDILADYDGQIQVETNEVAIPAGESRELQLSVTNTSSCIWRVLPDSAALFGVSYHLMSQEGSLLAWDQPRTWLTDHRREHLAFVAPGQTLPCKMRINAPEEPGRYRLQLDLVQEQRLWFSQKGVVFPEVLLEVTP